uniref:Uncharacterized protein n=1 Tax=Sphaerodactylus townsendi TaxID=933632 RepID=A0ACB8G917_9SAUR
MANLSAEGVETVIELQKKRGRQYLRELLEWEEFDEIRDLRRSIRLDTIYYSLVFAAEKGLPWLTVAEVGNLTVELLDETPDVMTVHHRSLSAMEIGSMYYL